MSDVSPVEELIFGLLDLIREGAGILSSPDGPERWLDGARLLRAAGAVAGDIPGDVLADTRTFATVLHLRTELGSCVLAADRLSEAGVSDTVVTDVLRKGAIAAEHVLLTALPLPDLVGELG